MKKIANIIKITSISLLVSLFVLGIYNSNSYGTAVTSLTGSDSLSNFPTTYNANLTALNAGKIEVSTTTLPLLTTLANLSTVGTITSGIWNGTALTAPFGGTGSTTLSTNQLLTGNGTGNIGVISGFGTTGQFLTSNGSGLLPSWQSSTVNQTADYTWTGAHIFNTATTTFNSGVDIEADSAAPVIFNGVELVFPSTDGANGSFLKNDGTGIVSWASSTLPLLHSTTTTQATDVASFTAVSFTVPADTLSTGNSVMGKIFFSWRNVSVSLKSITLKYGGTTCATGNATPDNTTDLTIEGIIDFIISSDGTTGGQICSISLEGSADAWDSTASYAAAHMSGNGTASVDSTTAQTVNLNIVQNSSVSEIFTVRNVVVYRLGEL